MHNFSAVYFDLPKDFISTELYKLQIILIVEHVLKWSWSRFLFIHLFLNTKSGILLVVYVLSICTVGLDGLIDGWIDRYIEMHNSLQA